MRFSPTLLSAALACAFGLALPARAQQVGLPDIGSSAGELLTPQQEQEYGAYTLYQLRRYGYVLEDPLLDSWLSGMGHRLAASSDRPEQPFTFFMMRDRQINAFATLGGYVAVNAGTVLAARNEDEIAGVLAHEISHVTQRHVLRAVERAKKDQLPIMLATLGVIIAAQESGGQNKSGYGDSRGDAIQAAVIGGQALAAQRQLDYTRTSEAEADRVGIQTLFRSGYNADGMADFFERMERLTRADSGDEVPSYLSTHPVTTTRLSEARDRAERLRREKPAMSAPHNPAASNPLLPFALQSTGTVATAPPLRQFDWARERMRVLSALTPDKAVREAKAQVDDAAGKPTDAQRYGLALAESRNGFPAAADDTLAALAKAHPDNLFVGVALAENAWTAHNEALSRQRFEALMSRHPDDRTVIISYAAMLNAIGGADAGRRAQAILRPILPANADDPLFQKTFGRASELAGDDSRAGEAFAEAAYLNGRAEDALNQFNSLLKRNDLSYIQRSRIEARIAEITPEVLDMQRHNMRPQDQPPDSG